MSLLVLIPSEMEWKYLIPKWLPGHSMQRVVQTPQACFVQCGFGLVQSMLGLQNFLKDTEPNLRPQAILLLGICGAYAHSGLQLEQIVRVETSVLGDFGASDAKGLFIPGTQLGWGPCEWGAAPSSSWSSLPVQLANQLGYLPGVQGASVHRVVSRMQDADERERVLDVQVEDMEGAGVFALAQDWNIPAFQVRAISNIVGEREPQRWKAREALSALTQWFLRTGITKDQA